MNPNAASLRNSLIIALLMGLIPFSAPGAERTEAVESRRHFDASDIDRLKIYDDDPENIWNQVFRLFFIRNSASDGTLYGFDELDPLLWPKSDYFLPGGADYKLAHLTLEQFLKKYDPERPISHVKRALMQRDLWAVYDWVAKNGDAHPRESHKLKILIARAIAALALSREQIENLPDNYGDTWAALATHESRSSFDSGDPNEVDLPYDLTSPDGEWVALWNDYEVANVTPVHASHFSARSQFWVLIRLPEGREATLEYLNQLKNPWGIQKRSELRKASAFRPKLAQFPVNTEVALVRQMVLIDDQGELVPSPLIEMVQLRRFLTDPSDRKAEGPRSTFIEFRMSHQQLGMGTGPGLVRVPEGDIEYPIFETHANDPFRIREVATPYAITPEPIYGRCTLCHSGRGIMSLQSRGSYIPTRPKFPAIKAEDISFDPVRVTSHQKRGQYDWGMLKGMIEVSGE